MQNNSGYNGETSKRESIRSMVSWKGFPFRGKLFTALFQSWNKDGSRDQKACHAIRCGNRRLDQSAFTVAWPPRYTKRVSRRVYVTYVARRAGLMFPVTWPATRYQFVTLSARSRAPTLLFLSRSRERESESALRTRRFRALARRGRKRGSLTLSIEA